MVAETKKKVSRSHTHMHIRHNAAAVHVRRYLFFFYLRVSCLAPVHDGPGSTIASLVAVVVVVVPGSARAIGRAGVSWAVIRARLDCAHLLWDDTPIGTALSEVGHGPEPAGGSPTQGGTRGIQPWWRGGDLLLIGTLLPSYLASAITTALMSTSTATAARDLRVASHHGELLLRALHSQLLLCALDFFFATHSTCCREATWGLHSRRKRGRGGHVTCLAASRSTSVRICRGR